MIINSVIICLNQKSKTPSDVTLLGRTSGKVFVLLSSSHLSMLFILLLFFSLLFDIIPHPPVDYRRGFYTPFYTFSPAHRRVIRNSLFNHSLLAASATALSEHFLPTGIFYVTLLPDIFGTTCFYQGFPGSRKLFLEICRTSYWSSKQKPAPSVCLIHGNSQSFIHLKFVFIHVNIANVFTCVENFDKEYRSAAALFISHENIK